MLERRSFEGPEVEKPYSSRIVLSFRRHGDKEKVKEGQTDREVELTAKGRGQAMAKANPDANLEQSIAFGSPRVRSQQTAAYEMAGAEDEITGDETDEELKAKLNSGLNYGSKIGEDVRLDFPEKPGSEYVKKALSAYAEGRLIDYLVHDSDKDAAELGDDYSYTYGRLSAQVAQILEKYHRIARQWDKLVKGERDGQKRNYADTLERYMGTHASVGESFMAKLIELTKGVEERERFVAALKGASFNVAEGFKVEIENRAGAEPTLHVSYRKENEGQEPFVFDEDISWEVIKQMAE